jgi:hypothetical protein
MRRARDAVTPTSYRGQWVRLPLESALPHEITNHKGERVGYFKSKGAATRELHRRQKTYDKRRHGPDDPRKWTIQPVREGE